MAYDIFPDTFLMVFSFAVDYPEAKTLAFTCQRYRDILTKIAQSAEFWHHHASRVLGKDTKEIPLSLLRWITKGGNPIPLKDDPLLIRIMMLSGEENEKLAIDYVYDNQKAKLVPAVWEGFEEFSNRDLIVNMLERVPEDLSAQYFASQKQVTVAYLSQLRKLKQIGIESGV